MDHVARNIILIIYNGILDKALGRTALNTHLLRNDAIQLVTVRWYWLKCILILQLSRQYDDDQVFVLARKRQAAQRKVATRNHRYVKDNQ